MSSSIPVMTRDAGPSRPLGLLTASLVALVIAACGASAPAAVPSAAARASTAALALAPTVSPAQADRLQKDGALVLDVREPSEWVTGHIDGATLIPLGELPARLGELPRDRSIVVVCRSGNRSAQGRDLLLQAGFAAVASMDGGMADWVAAGLPVVTGS
jgi:rhodanese-related sulfurtransferase